MKKKTFKQSLIASLILLLGITALVGCGSDDDEPTDEVEVTEEIEEGIGADDLVGTWGEDGEMRLLLSPDGTGTWIDVFGEIEWEIVDGDFHVHLPDDMTGSFEIELEGDWLFIDSIMAEDIEFNYVRLSYEVEEIPEHPLLSASNEEIQQAVIDALDEADKEVFREVISFTDEYEFVAGLLGVEPTVVFEVLNQGVRSGNKTTTISIQRQDRLGNDISRGRDTSEENFSHWDFLYEFDDDGVLKIVMRHHFDFEADMSGVTEENFDAIENGMTLDDVSALLGSEGTLGVTSDNHELRTWTREFGGGTTVIISIYFIDDQVTTKAQVGW